MPTFSGMQLGHKTGAWSVLNFALYLSLLQAIFNISVRVWCYVKLSSDIQIDEICTLLGYYAALCGNILHHTTPRNIPEECSSHQHRGSSL
jgi:hypothetical protein